MICPKCGLDNAPDAANCRRCGARLDSAPDNPPSAGATLDYSTPQTIAAKGRVLAGRFEVQEEIGSGGMGTVYRVLDRKINEEMALKVLRPGIVPESKAVERFKNELRLARRVSHKNVCRLYDLHEETGTLFITMEYVRGEDLATLIRRQGRLSAGRAVALASQIAEGLAQAHKLGVIHRDLKPRNIMIDPQDNVRIMDFGIAREAAGADLTTPGMLIGTPDYMSPEQASGEATDPRTDIYALGAILFEMVTGRPPFEGDSPLAVALKHKSDLPPHPRALNAEVPEALDRLILKCLAKSKDDRPQSAEALVADLAAVAKAGASSSAAADASTAPAAPRAPSPTVAAEARALISSIAVLPFRDLSPQRDQDYLCEGLAEALINALAQVKDLKVAALTSSFFFKGKDEDIREIGRSLNVGSILEGSVQKSGGRLRVTAQLISVADGYHLWSERFDRSLKDVFAVQDEIAMAVVDKLDVGLLEEEKERVVKRHTRDEKAYELYLRGRYHWNRRSPKDMVQAVDCFQRAVDQDSGFALACVGIADVFNMLAEFGFIQPREAYLKSRSLLQKAREIDDSLGELFASLSSITYCYEWDLPAAERFARRSIELSPQSMWAHAAHGEILAVQDRMDEAFAEAQKALELDPLSSIAHAFHGILLCSMGKPEEGRATLLRAIDMEPDQPMFHYWLGMNYLNRPALPEKATESLRRAADLGVPASYGFLGMALAMTGRKEEARECLAKLEEIAKEPFVPFPMRFLFRLRPGLKHFLPFKKKYSPAYLKAYVYLALNRQEEALAEFEKSSQARDYLLPVQLKTLRLVDLPWVKDFMASPRFQALTAKIKYT
jgi:TolB-like protein/tetratricopeptide (TPR) repeat protein/predicted Ser/Thr protein kinase